MDSGKLCIDGMIWIGSSYARVKCSSKKNCGNPFVKKKPHCYAHEAEWRGCCRKIPSDLGWVQPGKSRIFLAHRDGLRAKHLGRIFGYFIVERIEKVRAPRTMPTLPLSRKRKVAKKPLPPQIDGHVYCAKTGDVIQNADIEIRFKDSGAANNTASGSDGYYLCELDKEGDVTLSASATGYWLEEISGIELIEGETREQDVYLFPVKTVGVPNDPKEPEHEKHPNEYDPKSPGSNIKNSGASANEEESQENDEEPDEDQDPPNSESDKSRKGKHTPKSPATRPIHDEWEPFSPQDVLDIFVDYSMFEEDRSCSLRLHPKAVYLVDALTARITERFSAALREKRIPEEYAKARTDKDRRDSIKKGRKLFYKVAEIVGAGHVPVERPEWLKTRSTMRGELVLFDNPPLLERRPNASFRGILRIDGNDLLDQIYEDVERPTIRYCKDLEGKMDQAKLTAMLAAKLHITKALAERFLKKLAEFTAEELKERGEAKLPGLGRLMAVHRSEREGRNPITGEAITISAGNVVRFRASKDLKQAARDCRQPKKPAPGS